MVIRDEAWFDGIVYMGREGKIGFESNCQYAGSPFQRYQGAVPSDVRMSI